MRDPARISRILQKLSIIWKASPDLRLGQLVCCLSKRAAPLSEDPFYVEDDKIEEELNVWIQTRCQKPEDK